MGETLGFQAMTGGPLETRSLIDEFLPTHDFSAAYEIRILASRYVVYQTLSRSDFSRVRWVRFLMALRAGKWTPRSSEPMNLHQRLQGTGFVILGEVPAKELVSGWRDNSKRLTADAVRMSRANNFLGSHVPDTRR